MDIKRNDETPFSVELKFHVLVVGDPPVEHAVRMCFTKHFESIDLFCTDSGTTAFDSFSKKTPDLIVLDMESRRTHALKFLSAFFKSGEQCNIIAIAEKPSIEDVVKCVRMGVNEFIAANPNSQKLRECLSGFFLKWEKKKNGAIFQADQQNTFDLHNIISGCPQMQVVMDIVQKIIKRPVVTVLLQGETGTGKEVIARCLHYGTHKNETSPFVEVNCSAIPENLLEAELFGYEKGAFTDAKFSKKGLFELADGGTLFLDEIGDMHLLLQAKLLKAIEEKKIRRLGGLKDISVNTRIIAATNADLEKLVENSSFRKDLYYRLSVINIYLPLLQERGEDILELAKFFLEKHSATYALPVRKLSPAAEQFIQQYDWPGNVRELQYVIERVVVLGESTVIELAELKSALCIKEQDIQKQHKTANGWERAIGIPRGGLSLKDSEMYLIAEILKMTKGNKTHASKILGISRPRLNRKIEEYSISLG
ncbi:MAG: sigma-54-dependent Fis family transcriptional regulator [Calditrichaeota bacterium]|nr:MAG: sigma-54-dependent Fis family transcriptional regulator [Calditrichota bacterium]